MARTQREVDEPDPDAAAIADLSYEEARDELISIVARLEGGQADLAESMRLWERGERLADHCARWLDGAQARLRAEETAAPARPTGQRAADAAGDGTDPGDAGLDAGVDEGVDEGVDAGVDKAVAPGDDTGS